MRTTCRSSTLFTSAPSLASPISRDSSPLHLQVSSPAKNTLMGATPTLKVLAARMGRLFWRPKVLLALAPLRVLGRHRADIVALIFDRWGCAKRDRKLALDSGATTGAPPRVNLFRCAPPRPKPQDALPHAPCFLSVPCQVALHKAVLTGDGRPDCCILGVPCPCRAVQAAQPHCQAQRQGAGRPEAFPAGPRPALCCSRIAGTAPAAEPCVPR